MVISAGSMGFRDCSHRNPRVPGRETGMKPTAEGIPEDVAQPDEAGANADSDDDLARPDEQGEPDTLTDAIDRGLPGAARRAPTGPAAPIRTSKASYVE